MGDKASGRWDLRISMSLVNHEIMEWFKLERTLKTILFQHLERTGCQGWRLCLLCPCVVCVLSSDISPGRQILPGWGEFCAGCTLENSEELSLWQINRSFSGPCFFYLFSLKSGFYSISCNPWNSRILRPNVSFSMKNILHLQHSWYTLYDFIIQLCLHLASFFSFHFVTYSHLIPYNLSWSLYQQARPQIPSA